MAENKDELEYILDRVRRHDDGRAAYKKKADSWEKMYRLDAGYGRTLKQAVMAGQEQITLPTPFTVVNLSERLLSSTPRIDVIPSDPVEKESVYNAEQCEKWLTAMWDEINWVQQRNVLADTRWYALVRGRWALEVKWIKENLPPAQKNTMFPIAIRNLDPLDVGIQRGPLMTEFAYHIFDMSLLDVMREWTGIADTAGTALAKKIERSKKKSRRWDRAEDETVRMIDYWCIDPETGKVQNAVLADDEFAKPLANSGYPDIPIICGRGDFAPGIGDEYDGLSILHAIDGLWQYQCRLASQQATGLLWHFWPAVTVMNENNEPIDDIEIGPGVTTPLPWGTRVEMHQIEPNVPLSQAVYSQIESYIQQATFPPSMYGQGGDIDSGYQASLFNDAAKGRIKNVQESLEMGLAHVNRLVLCLVDKKGGTKGVDIGVVNDQNNEKYKLNLNKKMIAGNYQTRVRIAPAMPQDEASRVTMGKILADGKYISAQTFRDKFLGIQVPTDETRRIALEELMQSDELRPYRMRRAAEEWYQEDALDMLFGTPFMPEPAPDMEWTKNEKGRVMLTPLKPQLPGPTGPDGGQPPGPNGPPGPPPLGPPGGAPGGLPPELAGALLGGAPPPVGGPPIQPPMPMPGPQGGSFLPPGMQGQFEGDSFGLPQDLDPAILDRLLNTPGSPDEQMRRAAGLPPEGVIPPGA